MDKKAGKLARIGALLLRQGESVDAIRYASQSIFLEPSLPAYKLLASALAKQKRNTAALHAFEAARTISGGDTDVALSVGHAAVLVALGRPAAAAEILSKMDSGDVGGRQEGLSAVYRSVPVFVPHLTKQ